MEPGRFRAGNLFTYIVCARHKMGPNRFGVKLSSALNRRYMAFVLANSGQHRVDPLHRRLKTVALAADSHPMNSGVSN